MPFAATVRIELVNTGDIYYGDEIILRAVIADATAAYTIRWEYNDGQGWEEIQGETEAEYRFIVTQENAAYNYRVVLLAQG